MSFIGQNEKQKRKGKKFKEKEQKIYEKECLPNLSVTVTSSGASPASLVSMVKDVGSLDLTPLAVSTPGPWHFTLLGSTGVSTGTWNGLPEIQKGLEKRIKMVHGFSRSRGLFSSYDL